MRSAVRRVGARRNMGSLALVGSLLATSLAQLATAAPVAAAAPKVTAAKDLPPLPSAAAPKVQPEHVRGDFADAPVSADAPAEVKRPKRDGFDPATSKVLDDETTPTKKAYLNADGTRTDVLTNAPARFRDARGAWREIDLSLVPAANGTLTAKSAERPAVLPERADGATTFSTPQGTVSVRHRGAAAVAGQVDGAAVTYPAALGRADLHIALRADGYEDFVVLPDAAAGSSFTEELTLPAGLSARDAEAGVELVDASGNVVATIHNGWAKDSAGVPPAVAPVSVRLAGDGAARVVPIEVSVDAAWLTDPARVFPVTIDPVANFSGSLALAQDAMVYQAAPTTNYGTFGELWVKRALLRWTQHWAGLANA